VISRVRRNFDATVISARDNVFVGGQSISTEHEKETQFTKSVTPFKQSYIVEILIEKHAMLVSNGQCKLQKLDLHITFLWLIA
jgi:hypothetical protein